SSSEANGHVPLGWRTIVASLAIVGSAVLSAALDVSQIVWGDRLDKPDGDLAAALIVGGAGLGLVVSTIIAIVFYCIWIHRAAKNLRALGRRGLAFTPGWCVGWFFVPFGNLVKPYQAVSEIWKASAPDADADGWRARSGSSLVGLWWAMWI